MGAMGGRCAMALLVACLVADPAAAQELFIGGPAPTRPTPDAAAETVQDPSAAAEADTPGDGAVAAPTVGNSAPPLANADGANADGANAVPTTASTTSADTAPPPAPEILRVRGLIEPRHQAVIASEIDAQIEALPFEDGERFQQGDVLVDFDCSFYRARLSGSDATAQAARRVLETNRQLAALNSIGVLDVAQAEAAFEEARAQARVDRVWVNRCEIEAPFDGRVIGRLAEPFESVQPGQELIAILNDQDLELRLIVPSNWLSWLTQGEAFDFAVDETGSVVAAEVLRIGARIDAVSQTLPVIARLSVDPIEHGLLAGMSGTALFERAVDPAS